MSLDLYQDTLVERVGNLTPTTEVEPGAFDGFLRGTGMATMRGFAQTARSAGMVGSVLPVLADKVASAIGGEDTTTLGDRYFKAVDETLGSAVDYWTPRPNEVGVAGQVVGSLLSVLPQAISSPPLVALQAADIGTELVGKGVSAGKASAVAGVMTTGMMAGIWMPILGGNLWQRTLVGGAGFNLAQGVASRGAAQMILAGLPEADQFKAFEPEAMTLDALLGMAFGSFAHISPAQRAAGKEAWDAIGRWAQGFSPSEVAATATLRTAQHLNTDSTPGIPVGTQDIDAHVTRMRTAIDQLVRGEDVNVENIKVPVAEGPREETIGPNGETNPPDPETIARREMGGDPLFAVDPARTEERARNAATMVAEGEAVRREEGIPRMAEGALAVPNDISELDPGLQARHIGEAVSQRLRSIEMDPEQAQAHGAIWEAFFKTAAEKYGVTPAELISRYGVDVQRMGSAENLVGALEQAGRRAAPEPRAIADADRLTLEHDQIRSLLGRMADEEAGWAQIGGRLDRARLIASTGDGEKLGTPAFTTWIPKQEWWTSRPGHPGRGLNETQVRGAVRKALAGEKMTKLERDTVDHMVDVLNERLAAERELGDDRWNEVGEAVVDQGLEPTTDNVMDAHLLARAVEIDRAAVEAAAAKYGPSKDVAGMMLEARRIVREHEEAQAAGQEGAAGEPGGAAARGGQPPGEETLYQRDEPGTWYYSELARQLDAAQIKSAPAKGWSDYLKSLPQKGVKAEEIRWSGLEEWLALQEGKVTKEQVTEFLKQGGVRVEEVIAGEGGERGPRDAAIARDVETLEAAGLNVDQDPGDAGQWGVMHDEEGEIFAYPGDADSWRASRVREPETNAPPPIPDDVVDAMDRVLTYLNTREPSQSFTQLGDELLRDHGWEHQMAPGLMPGDGGELEFRMRDDGSGRPSPWIGLEELRELEDDGPATHIASRMAGLAGGDPEGATQPTKYSQYQLPGGSNYREIKLILPVKGAFKLPEYHSSHGHFPEMEFSTAAEAQRESERRGGQEVTRVETGATRTFHSSHFDEPGILAHLRLNERVDADGKSVLFIEEIQSDWGKAVRNARERQAAKIAKQKGITVEQAMKDLPANAGFRDESKPPPITGLLEQYGWQIDEAPAEIRTARLIGTDGADALGRRSYNTRAEAIRDYVATTGRQPAGDGVTIKMSTEPAPGPWQLTFDDGSRMYYQQRQHAENVVLEEWRKDNPVDESAPPAAPFVGNTQAWSTLVMKRVIRYAAERGMDRVAWTRGEQQVERYTYALRKAVDVIEWEKTEDGIHLVGFKGKDSASATEERAQARERVRELDQQIDQLLGDRTVAQLTPAERGELDEIQHERSHVVDTFLGAPDPRSKVVDTTEKETALSDAIGKAMAEKIISDPGQKGAIEGADIKVSDTGMAGFYDRMLPSITKEVLKKLGGGKVGETEIEVNTAAAPPSLKKFTKMDWDTFMGAEAFENGDDPLIGSALMTVNGERQNMTLVVSRGGVEMFSDDGEVGVRLPAEEIAETWGKDAKDTTRQLGIVWTKPEFFDAGQVLIGDAKTVVRPAGGTEKQPAFDITTAMREKALAGLPLFQRGAQPATPPRGSITFGEGRTLIAMFETANASTFAHETGHLWLQMTRDLATREGVPPEAAADWATLATWLKIEGGEIPREAHEQFARGWEQYLTEGVAPNEGLRGVFQRFRDWLLEVYRNLTSRGLEIELTDEVRGVMGRMLDSQARDPSQTAAEAPGATRPAAAPDAQPIPNARQGAQPAPAGTPSAPPGGEPAQGVSSSSVEGGTPPPGGPAAEAPDMVATEAQRIATERPDLRIRVGTDEEGGAIYQTAADFLEAAKADAAQARDDKRLITAAAECLLGNL